MKVRRKNSADGAVTSKEQQSKSDHIVVPRINGVLEKVKKDTGIGIKPSKKEKIKQMLKAKRARQIDTCNCPKDNIQAIGSSVSRVVSANTSTKGVSSVRKGQAGEQGLSKLQQKMQQKLKGARFRWINETLYTTTGIKAYEMMQNDPKIFEEYHQGFTSQVEKWPVNPVDLFIKQLEMSKKRLVVADMGCGEAKLAATVSNQHQVHSFDLIAYNKHITACNIANVPLDDGVADVVIFCLALMGTDFIRFIREANRILRTQGELWVAEVVSRIPNVETFVAALEKQGFKAIHKNTSNKMFAVFQLAKIGETPSLFSTDPNDLLKPCIYKRR